MFIGSTYIVGLFGDPSVVDIKDVEKTAGELSGKPVKGNKKENVVFKFKEKGKKPVDVKGILQFQFTGDFNVDKLSEYFGVQGLKEMD